MPQLLLQPFSSTHEATQNPTCTPHILTFKYCRFEKILPQPGKSQGSSSLLAAFLGEENRKQEDLCRLSSTSLRSLPYPEPLPTVLPNSLGANLSSVLIPCRGQSRLSLTPRATGSKEGAEGLEGGPCPRMPRPLSQPSGYLARGSVCWSA